MADLHCINDYSSTNDDWNDFDGFQGEQVSELSKVTTNAKILLEDSVPRNCSNTPMVSSSGILSNNSDLPVQLTDLLALCFCRTVNKCDKSTKSICSSTSLYSTSSHDVLVGNP